MANSSYTEKQLLEEKKYSLEKRNIKWAIRNLGLILVLRACAEVCQEFAQEHQALNDNTLANLWASRKTALTQFIEALKTYS